MSIKQTTGNSEPDPPHQSASETVREAQRQMERRDQHPPETIARIRQEIETGWQQSERGEVIDGPSLFVEIRRLSKARRRAGNWK